MRARKIKTILLAVVALALPSLTVAAPKVGPLDNTPGPSLAPLDSPQLAEAPAKVADFTFPVNLEKAGDLSSAVLEWQRIATQFAGHDRARALLNAARLQVDLGSPAASATLRQFLKENPDFPEADALTYLVVWTAPEADRVQFLKVLAEATNPSDWQQEALYRAVWQEARTTGRVTQVYGLEKGLKLQQRLEGLNQKLKLRRTMVQSLGFVPGAAQLFLKDYAHGGLVLALWALFGLAFVSACRQRHFAYACVFVLPFAGLWVASPGAARAAASAMDARDKMLAMTLWVDLQPVAAPVVPADFPTVSAAPAVEIPVEAGELPEVSATAPAAVSGTASPVRVSSTGLTGASSPSITQGTEPGKAAAKVASPTVR